jgi:hypothetical protein
LWKPLVRIKVVLNIFVFLLFWLVCESWNILFRAHIVLFVKIRYFLFSYILFLILNSCILLHADTNIFVFIVLFRLTNNLFVSVIVVKRTCYFLIFLFFSFSILWTISIYVNNGYPDVISFISVLDGYWVTTRSIAIKFSLCSWYLIIETSLYIANSTCSIFCPLSVYIFILFPWGVFNLLFCLCSLFGS